MKTVQQPGFGTAIEDAVVGAARQIRIDTDREEIRLHNGLTPGGMRIPNINQVRATIAEELTGQAALVKVVADSEELANLTPGIGILAAIRQSGEEDVFVWQAGAGGPGTIASLIDGYWKRVTSVAAIAIRLATVGLINLQIDSVEPPANQDEIAWLTAGVLKLWDGTAYVNANPQLFTRLLRYRTAGGSGADLLYSGTGLTIPRGNLVAATVTASARLILDLGPAAKFYEGIRIEMHASGPPTPRNHPYIKGTFSADGVVFSDSGDVPAIALSGQEDPTAGVSASRRMEILGLARGSLVSARYATSAGVNQPLITDISQWSSRDGAAMKPIRYLGLHMESANAGDYVAVGQIYVYGINPL